MVETLHSRPDVRKFDEEGVVRLVSLRVRNYRTVGAVEQTLPLEGGLTIVGPNNTGKTNLLRAVELLFTGPDNVHGYATDTDLTFGNKGVKTSLLATFDGDDFEGSDDRSIYESLESLHKILGTERQGSNFTLSLQFPASGTPVYQFFPNVKQPDVPALRTQFSRTQRQLVVDLLARFTCHYVPSARSMREMHEELLVPFLRVAVARALEPHTTSINATLSDVAKSFDAELAQADLSNLQVNFALPNNSLEQLLRGFDFQISDPERTSIFMKGQGIQSTVFLAGLLWMTQQETADGKSVIWLLEEPESYLHPDLSRSAALLLDRLREHALTVVTTHSLTFVPQDPTALVGTILDENRTRIEVYQTYAEATQRLRVALGVRFSDYYNLGQYNLLVEGPSDRELIRWFLEVVPETIGNWPKLRSARLLDFGGVKHLSGFLRATYSLIAKERVCVAVFDGDAAGEKERRDLQQYFGQKRVPFEANTHFLSVRSGFSIEGLFPDEWMVDIHDDHPDWFEEYSVDVSGALEPYKVRDARKATLQGLLTQRAAREIDLSWASRWTNFAEAAENALATLVDRLNR